MNLLFADWHREVSVDLAGIDLAARQSVADEVAVAAARDDVLRLVAIAFGRPEHGDEAWLREPFKKREAAFPMRENTAELRMLASAVLEQICRDGDELRVLASYAVAVAGHRGWSCPVEEVPQTARATLRELAVTARTAPLKPRKLEVVVWTEEVEAASVLVASSGNGTYAGSEAVRQGLEALGREADAALARAVEYTGAVAAWAESKDRLAAEETQLLWWLLSGQSTSLRQAWASLPAAVAAVAAGRELALIAAVLPAPPHSEALLLQLLTVKGRSRRAPGSGDPSPTPLDVSSELAFLVEANLAKPGGDLLAVALHSLEQAMLLRAWEELG